MMMRNGGSREIKTAVFPGRGATVSELIATQHALLGAPPEYLTPLERPTLAEAQAWCRELATTHYENFHVATFFLPRKVRPHFESIYAYCRVADDLGR